MRKIVTIHLHLWTSILNTFEVSNNFGPKLIWYICVFVSISSTIYKQLFSAQIPKAQKRHSQVVSLFALSGSAHIKAACRMLIKLTPVVDFINIFRVHFLYKMLAPKNTKLIGK